MCAPIVTESFITYGVTSSVMILVVVVVVTQVRSIAAALATSLVNMVLS